MLFDLNELPVETKSLGVLHWEKIKKIKSTSLEPKSVDTIRQTGWRMVQTCLTEDGIGLAAPQVGLFKKIMLCRVMDGDGWTYKFKPEFRLYLNPDFSPVLEKGKGLEKEFCLSVPGKGYDIERFKKIEVSWDEPTDSGTFERKHDILEGWAARLFQHECLPRSAKIATQDGIKTIGEIVDKEWKGKVWSINPNTKSLELKPVIGWQKKYNKQKKQWVRIKTSTTGPNKQLRCTEEHPCAIVHNILEPKKLQINFLPAKELTGQYILRKPLIRQQNSETPLYNQEQLSSIVGGLLGDLCISSRGEIIISHGEPQSEYAYHKATLLGGFCKSGYSGFRNEKTNVVVSASTTEQTKLLRQLSYRPRKTVKHLLPFIDEVALAYWYMDDGCLKKQKYAQFHTEGFSKTDVETLQNFLLEKFSIESKLQHRKTKSGLRWYLRLNKKPSETLFSLIHPYVINCMEYKLPKQFRGQYHKLNSEPLAFSAKRVTEVVPVFHESFLFDLTIEDNSNYFADNTLVHNCDHLNGISIPQRWELQHKPVTSKKKKKKR